MREMGCRAHQASVETLPRLEGRGGTSVTSGWVALEMSFAFEEGQCVHHRSGGMASIVTDKERTTQGREHYRLWDIDPVEMPRRQRWFLGEYLRVTERGDEECRSCLMRGWCKVHDDALPS